MACLVGLIPTVNAILRPSLSYPIKKERRNIEAKSKSNDRDELLLQTAIANASLRFHETLRPEPLFIDPYAACFLPSTPQVNEPLVPHHYCVATKVIDDKLVGILKQIDGPKQVVLLTDGMDTRPYRLKWPNSTLIFDVSPKKIFQKAAQKLEDVGAKIPRSCVFVHVPFESSDLQHDLCNKGFNGNRPSVWLLQGLPVMDLARFKEVLVIVSSLAMKGCVFLGELPVWLAETESGTNFSTMEWMDKLFMSHGFRVESLDYHDKVEKNLCEDAKLEVGKYNNIVFVAEQLRFSDDQMEKWRSEFQRIEDEGDEDGFEEL